jgi:hypothetical protein
MMSLAEAAAAISRSPARKSRDTTRSPSAVARIQHSARTSISTTIPPGGADTGSAASAGDISSTGTVDAGGGGGGGSATACATRGGAGSAGVNRLRACHTTNPTSATPTTDKATRSQNTARRWRARNS